MKNHTVHVDPEIGLYVNGRPITTHWLVVERDENLKTVRRQSVEGLVAANVLAHQWRLEMGSLAPKQWTKRKIKVWRRDWYVCGLRQWVAAMLMAHVVYRIAPDLD